MSISSQLPPIPLAQAGAGLRALLQSAGQVEAKVVGQAANGTTQVQIGQQTLNLTLPTAQPPGTTLSLAIQQSQGQLTLTLLGSTPPPGGQTVAGSAGTVSQQNVPATSVQLSAAALSSQVQGGASAVSQTPSSTPGTVTSVSTPLASSSPSPSGSASGPSQGIAAQAPQYSSPLIPGSGPLARPVTAPIVPQTIVASAAPPQTPAAAGPVPGPAPSSSRPQQPAIVQLASTAMPAAGPSGAPTLPPGPVPYVAAAAPVQGSRPGATPVPGPAAPVQQVASATASGQQNAQLSSSGTPAAPLAASAGPATANPQMALTQMVQQALPQQTSVVALTTALSAVMGKIALPEPVLKAAQQVLGQRMDFDAGKLDGATIKAAVEKSGILQESLLAAGNARAAGADMKSALQGLRQTLVTWLGTQAPVEQVAHIAPPLKGLTPRARTPDAQLPDMPQDAREAGKALLDRTEGALSRLRLHQNASLPDQMNRHDTNLSLDLPVIINWQQALLQMQIHGDPESADQRPEDRSWQVRFALNLAQTGEVGAQISLRGRSTGILIWTERPEIATALSSEVSILRSDLEQIGLLPGSIIVRQGAPAPQPVTESRHIVDAVR